MKRQLAVNSGSTAAPLAANGLSLTVVKLSPTVPHRSVTAEQERVLGLSLATADGEAAGATVRTTTHIAAAHISFGLKSPNEAHPDREGLQVDPRACCGDGLPGRR
ncbi:hypothetical protein GCM10023170_090300 [Phytohabitans houttuyneae]|uniref:Uncharacterized protein n=1 Tax=Phytohabitans houttuyneae TaxID=1076126 RepID=A0A6V8K1A4_9ACTN|nr:hypothetical protein Phou_002380 [Phytohabitans houttuyneae]